MKLRTWERGNIAFRIAVNLALVALAVLIYLKKDIIFNRRQAPPIAAQPRVTPEPTPTRTPPPEQQEQPEAADQPVEQPRIESTPPVAATTPKPFGLDTLAARPEMWPRQVALREPVTFTLVRNGVAAGKMQVPAGAIVEVRKFNGKALELGYRGALAVAAAGATDFEALARAKQSAAASPPAASSEISAPTNSAAPPPAAAAAQSADPRRLDVEVIRAKKTRIEGGDWDDKKDRISLRLKMKNQDTRLPIEGLKGHIFVFGDSIVSRGTVRLLQKQEFDVSIPPLQTFEFQTEEVENNYDTTGAKFGYKYCGWVLLVRDRSGKIVFEKSTSATLLHHPEKLADLESGSDYDKSTWAPRKTAGRPLP